MLLTQIYRASVNNPEKKGAHCILILSSFSLSKKSVRKWTGSLKWSTNTLQIPHEKFCLHHCPSSSFTVFTKLLHWDRDFESHLRHGCMSAFFRTVLSCVGSGLAIGRSPAQGVLPKCLSGFTASEVNFES